MTDTQIDQLRIGDQLHWHTVAGCYPVRVTSPVLYDGRTHVCWGVTDASFGQRPAGRMAYKLTHKAPLHLAATCPLHGEGS